MIVVHAAWSRELGLCLWGEDSALPARAPGRPGRPAKTPAPRPHPFASSAAALETALERFGVPLPDSAAAASLTVRLPSSRGGPQASPRLLRVAGERAGRDRIDAWEIPVLALGAGPAALDVASSLPAGSVAGVAVADSLEWAAGVCKLALELVARGRLRPALARRGEAWVARWLPVTDDPEDSIRVALLTRSAPGVIAPADARGAFVAEMLAAHVDALARGLLDGVLPAASGSP
ncbi:MAG TPA: hypothetical protein VED41_02145, partial [Solirubrobacteraceae bacterium]|nr:hypothetical protein [Solirubrobacteraceae bacterium]